MKKLSIVIPCYNEEEILNQFYTELTNVLNQIKKDYTFEIIFIDDGSTDKTLQILQDFQKNNNLIHIISFSRNFGKESAIHAGLKDSNGDLVVLMDSDLQHPPKIILEMLTEVNNGFDMVATKRLNRKGEPIIKSFFSKLFYKIMKNFLPMEEGVQDFRIMTREVVNAILSLDEYNRFSKGIFSWIGFKTKYIVIEHIKRPSGKTKWNFRKLFSYAVDGITSFSTLPLKISAIIGTLISVLATIFAIIIIIQTLYFGKDVPGYDSTITAVLFIGGIQLLSIGILSEYISKIYLEIKNRPKYIIKNQNGDSTDETNN